MKLFIDSSNGYFILAAIKNNKVVSFSKEKTNKNVTSLANKWLEEFFVKSKFKITDIEDIYISIGPGSFTGLRVSENIANVIAQSNNIKRFYVINSLKLQSKPKTTYSAMSFGKGKFYTSSRYSNFKKFKTTTTLPKGKYILDYEDFNEMILEKKLKNFRKKSKIALLYPKTFY